MERLRRAIGPTASFFGKSSSTALGCFSPSIDCSPGPPRPCMAAGRSPKLFQENMSAYRKKKTTCSLPGGSSDHPSYGAWQEIMKEWFAHRITSVGELCRGVQTIEGALTYETVRRKSVSYEKRLRTRSFSGNTIRKKGRGICRKQPRSAQAPHGRQNRFRGRVYAPGAAAFS